MLAHAPACIHTHTERILVIINVILKIVGYCPQTPMWGVEYLDPRPGGYLIWLTSMQSSKPMWKCRAQRQISNSSSGERGTRRTPWGSLVSQPSLLAQFQANKRDCLKHKEDGAWSTKTWGFLLTSTCMYTVHKCSYIRKNVYTHTKTYTWTHMQIHLCTKIIWLKCFFSREHLGLRYYVFNDDF